MTRSSLTRWNSSNRWFNFLADAKGKFSTSRLGYFPLLVGSSILMSTLFLWQALVRQERAYIQQETQLAAESVKNELLAGMESRTQALVRLSERWEWRGKTPKDDWEFEAGLNVRDFKGFQAIQWVDPSLHVRWVVPLVGNEASRNLNLAMRPQRRAALETAREQDSITLTRTVKLEGGGTGFLIDVPIIENANSSGFIVGVFRTKTVLDTILAGEKKVAPGYTVAVVDGKEEIYRRGNGGKLQYQDQWNQETKIDLHGTTWQIRVWPTPNLLAQLQSPLPEAVLTGGLLTALLLAVAVHLAQSARLRAKQAELAKQELESEVSERQRTERLLRVQHAITRILAAAVTLGGATSKILQAIGENLGWDLGELWLVDQKANVLRCVNAWHSPLFKVPKTETLPWKTTFSPGIGLPGLVWANSKVIWMSDVFQDTNLLPAANAAKKGLHGAFGFPIVSGSKIIGVITFFSYQNQRLDEGLLRIITDIGSQSGQFIERKWAEEALLKAHNELERRVDERTVELSRSNQLLKQEIVERKRVEEQIKASLKEKEVLLKEIHHRVKNNLQVISSLLNLQCRSITDEQTLAIFQESQHRVESMAYIHEQLYQSKDLSRIDFAEYIRKLAANLFCAYEASTNAITLKIDSENVLLDIQAAIPCGLIVNELVSNSLKYAFSTDKKGEISIEFNSVDDNFTLIVSDNGKGFPQDLDFRNTESLGLQLVNALTEQLEGNIELDNSIGTEFKITFMRKPGVEIG